MEQEHTRRGLRRSREEMYEVMARYAASGQTQAGFCAAEGLALGTFQYWWRRYRQETGDEAGSFVALVPEAPAEAEAGIELHYGPVRLRMWGVGPGYLADLVHKLGAGC